MVIIFLLRKEVVCLDEIENEIIDILLKYEDALSDGYVYYTGEERLDEILLKIAKEIKKVFTD
jgi:hypothetical protein